MIILMVKASKSLSPARTATISPPAGADRNLAASARSQSCLSSTDLAESLLQTRTTWDSMIVFVPLAVAISAPTSPTLLPRSSSETTCFARLQKDLAHSGAKIYRLECLVVRSR